jgi:hypothetical protein
MTPGPSVCETNYLQESQQESPTQSVIYYDGTMKRTKAENAENRQKRHKMNFMNTLSVQFSNNFQALPPICPAPRRLTVPRPLAFA